MEKSERINRLTAEAKDIIQSIGLDLTKETPRRAERMAMALMAVAGVSNSWKEAKSLKDGRKLITREVIEFINENFEESISPGSYDDIRRKDMKKLVLADLIINSGDNPNAATNDPTRGYSLDHEFKELIRTYGTKRWSDQLSKFLALKGDIFNKLSKPRLIEKMPVALPDGSKLELGNNYHNSLQKAVIEEFLSRFGYNTVIVYIGDASHRHLINNKEVLRKLEFPEINNEQLPDIIAYSPSKNWLYLIEAVTSAGPMSDERVFELKKIASDCKAELIFVTAFLTRSDFKKWVDKIAWETEVWISDNPDHMIHFNGDKFLGPH